MIYPYRLGSVTLESCQHRKSTCPSALAENWAVVAHGPLGKGGWSGRIDPEFDQCVVGRMCSSHSDTHTWGFSSQRMGFPGGNISWLLLLELDNQVFIALKKGLSVMSVGLCNCPTEHILWPTMRFGQLPRSANDVKWGGQTGIYYLSNL